MEKHIIIIDLDGTLMLDFSHYDPETIDYLKFKGIGNFQCLFLY